MSNDNHRGFHGELLPPEAIRKGVYDLGKVARVPPEVGIFDAPTRCFVVNQEWWSHIAGMVHLLADVVSWKDAEDESYFAIQAILKFMQGVDCAMNCEEVADCVESQILVNQELINAITLSMTNNGFGNPNHINPQITTIIDRNPVNAMQEEILELEDCNLDKLWGGIRNGIVLRLDDNARDLLEDLAGIPNVVERLNVFIDIVPTAGDLAEGLVFQITEIIPDLLDLYNSYSSLERLDEIACGIFSLVCSLCRYPTFEEVFNYYNSNALSGVNLASATWNELAQLLLDIVFQPAGIAYHTIIVWEMFVLNLQSVFNGVAGSDAITDMARLGEDAPSNNWIQLCEVCDELYRIKIWDFTETDKDSYRTSSYPTTSGHGIYIPGTGWIPQQLGAEGNGFISVGISLKPEWRIRAIGLKFANQAEGNGNLTFNIFRTIVAQNAGGTSLAIDWGTTGWTYYENSLLSITGFKEYGISYSTQLNLNRALTHIGIIFDAEYAPPDAQPTAVNTFSGTVFP